ncbi:hypothetical protein PoB_000385300 [Plakobranchus ocellatus]|uniref:Uncharacterized protein n=1 Tax=Plakobranchus ocellatus TaxID=259542 RepID=A0AAV3Y582_9GAST|nr:hypothetical protein PoB_000385300 [Plakobranchus ocellatus]
MSQVSPRVSQFTPTCPMSHFCAKSPRGYPNSPRQVSYLLFVPSLPEDVPIYLNMSYVSPSVPSLPEGVPIHPNMFHVSHSVPSLPEGVPIHPDMSHISLVSQISPRISQFTPTCPISPLCPESPRGCPDSLQHVPRLP